MWNMRGSIKSVTNVDATDIRWILVDKMIKMVIRLGKIIEIMSKWKIAAAAEACNHLGLG